MVHPILGLHHVTATVNDAQADLDLCAGALGMRLVKKTVNFDNRGVYHFYYGNEHGTPGTIWTTFPYRGKGVPAGHHGAGQIVRTSFSVPAKSLPFWQDRLGTRATAVRPGMSAFGEQTVEFSDASGLSFELVGAERDDRAAWTGSGMNDTAAIRGLHGVTMLVRDPDRTLALMSDVLGFRIVRQNSGAIRVTAGGDAPGHLVDILHDPSAGGAMNGLGTVHHVAFAIATSEEQLALRDDLLRLGFHVTPVMDRCYFESIYFREPGGVLFEVATVSPGFLIDEAAGDLGRNLKLPPWEEPNRTAIESGLPAIAIPAAKARPSAAEVR